MTSTMTNEIEPEELDEQEPVELPDREVMSIISSPGDGFVDLEFPRDPTDLPPDPIDQ